MDKEKNYGIIVVIILSIVLLVSGIFIFIKSNNKNNNKEVKLSNQNNQENINKEAYEYMELALGGTYVDGFNNAIDNLMMYNLEENQRIKVAEFNDNTLSELVYHYASNNNYLKTSNNKQKDKYLEEDDAIEIYNKIFGSYVIYEKITKSDMCPNFSYDKAKRRYIYSNNCGLNTNVTKYSKIISSEKKDNTLSVIEEVAYYRSDLVENNIFDNYTDAINNSNSVGTISSSTEVEMQNLKNDISKYKFIFKKWNDKYYFYSIERIA